MKFSGILAWISQPKHLWFTIFLYTILSGLFVQLILLPYIFPAWHAGNGLIKGVDGLHFHRLALEVFLAIENDGWSQWQILPHGQLVSGIAAFCYAMIHPSPWAVLPVNALLNATACLCFYLIFSNLTGSHQKGLLASLPFIFFPSALLWNTQFHNENYAVPGVIFILYGWLIITKTNDLQQSTPVFDTPKALTFIILGSLLLGLVRSYILSGMTYLFLCAGVMLCIYWMTVKNGVRRPFYKLTKVGVACLSMLLVLSIINNQAGSSSSSSSTQDKDPASSGKGSRGWEQTFWLPEQIDKKFQELAKYRKSFVKEWSDGGSSIDLDVTFKNVGDMVAYIPRSLQISFLSPFPNIWFAAGKKAAGSAMRIASSVEMMVSYFCLLGLPFFIRKYWKEPSVWVFIFVCTSMLIVYAMIVPNQGALYRFRYPYYMPLIGFGLVGWLESKLIPRRE